MTPELIYHKWEVADITNCCHKEIGRYDYIDGICPECGKNWGRASKVCKLVPKRFVQTGRLHPVLEFIFEILDIKPQGYYEYKINDLCIKQEDFFKSSP